MIKLSVDVTSDTWTPYSKQIRRQLQALPQKALKVFTDNTPIRTGNARRNTSLTNEVIRANYAYADKLDRGASRQSPQGMVKPTEQFVRNEVKRITGA